MKSRSIATPVEIVRAAAFRCARASTDKQLPSPSSAPLLYKSASSEIASMVTNTPNFTFSGSPPSPITDAKRWQ